MRKVTFSLLSVVVASLLVATLTPSAVAASPDISRYSKNYGKAWKKCTPTLNGVKTTVAAKQRTVIVVNQSAKTRAVAAFYVRVNGKACTLHRMFRDTSSRIGYGGTVTGSKRKQDTGTTPLGEYSITQGFGIKNDVGTWVPYHKVTSKDWWDEDPKSKTYNSLRSSTSGFRKSEAEHLIDYKGPYDYALVINFNRKPDATPVKGRGAGIFLHVNGSGATAGCVSISRTNMRIVLSYLMPGDKIKIVK